MRIDIVSVFPEYFNVFDLSLLGKAKDRGLLEVHSHNLRDWTHDVHHSVDDTPVGGGAGMVMKPEVWAECLDDLLGLDGAEASPVIQSDGAGDSIDSGEDVTPSPVTSDEGNGGIASPVVLSDGTETPLSSVVLSGGAETPLSSVVLSDGAETPLSSVVLSGGAAGPEVEGPHTPENTGTAPSPAVPDGDVVPSPTALDARPILIFPNPSAPLFTQEAATELSHAGRLVFGCGRYEGYDARVPAYYRERGFDVREYSIGDYVLNGGEVAVSVMVEAITRLLPGFMGNPDSIVEESYTGEPLLEHRQYTKPATWRGMKVPEVLLSGDHGKVDRYRRDESLARTTEVRPDLVERLDCRALSKADRKTLMALGWNVSGDHPKR